MFLKRQEIVEFDPTNKDHRAAFRAFMKRKAWADCPLRFTHDPGYGSIAEQVQAKMIDWYIAQDEASEAKKAVRRREVPMSKRTIRDTGVIATTGDKVLAFQLAGIASEFPQGENHAA